MGPLFRTSDADLGNREVAAIASAETILAGETSGATAASLQRLLDRCKSAERPAARESATAALEQSLAHLTKH